MSQEDSQSQSSKSEILEETQIAKQEKELQDKNFNNIISIGLNDALLKPSFTNIISIQHALEAYKQRQISGKISIKVQGQFFLSASQILRKKINQFTQEMREYFENFKKQNVTQIKRKVDPNSKKKKTKKGKDNTEEEDQDDARSTSSITADLARNAIDDPRHQARQGGEDLAITDTFPQQDDFNESNEEDTDLRHQSHQSSAFKSMMEESGKKTVKELSQAGSQAQSGFQTPARNYDTFGYNPQIDEEDPFQSENRNDFNNKDQNMILEANKFFQNQMENKKYAEDSEQIEEQRKIRNKKSIKNTNKKQKKVNLDENIDLNSEDENNADDDLRQYLRNAEVNNHEDLEIQLEQMLKDQLENLQFGENQINENNANNQTIINMNLDFELDLNLQDDADIAAQNLNLKIQKMNLTATNNDEFMQNQGSTFENTVFNNVGMNEDDFNNLPQYENNDDEYQNQENNENQNQNNNNDISDLFNATKLQDKTLNKAKVLSAAEQKEFRQFEQFYANLQRICNDQEQSITYVYNNNPGSFSRGELFYNIMVLKKLGKINVRQDSVLNQSEIYIKL